MQAIKMLTLKNLTNGVSALESKEVSLCKIFQSITILLINLTN